MDRNMPLRTSLAEKLAPALGIKVPEIPNKQRVFIDDSRYVYDETVRTLKQSIYKGGRMNMNNARKQLHLDSITRGRGIIDFVFAYKRSLREIMGHLNLADSKGNYSKVLAIMSRIHAATSGRICNQNGWGVSQSNEKTVGELKTLWSQNYNALDLKYKENKKNKKDKTIVSKTYNTDVPDSQKETGTSYKFSPSDQKKESSSAIKIPIPTSSSSIELVVTASPDGTVTISMKIGK